MKLETKEQYELALNEAFNLLDAESDIELARLDELTRAITMYEELHYQF